MFVLQFLRRDLSLKANTQIQKIIQQSFQVPSIIWIDNLFYH